MADVSLGIKITADGKNARAEITSLNGELSKLPRNLRETESASQAANRGLSSLGVTAGRVAGFFSAYALYGYTKALIDIGDRATVLDSRLKLVTNSARQFAAVQSALYTQAQANGTAIESQAELYAKLARATEGSGRSARDLLTITDVVAKSLRIGGTSAAQAAGAMLQFGQAAGSGVVRAEEFNSMLEGMPTLVQGVAKALGMTTAELKNLVNQGQITSAQWLDAMVRMKDETDRQASAMAGTFGQAFERVKNSVFAATAALDKFLGVSQAAAGIMNRIAGGLDQFAGTDQVSTFTKRIEDLRAQIERESNKPLAFLNTEKIARMRQSLADMEKALADLKQQSATVADPLAEGFGKAKFEIQSVGKTAEDTMAAIAAAAKRYNVPEAFALAIWRQETGWMKGGYQSAVSPKGAIGTMQLMPGTAQRLGVDARDAMQNIEGGVKLLAQLLKKYGDDFKRAAAAYNAGEGNVDRYGGTPPFRETQDYVQKVAGFYEQFRQQYPNGLDFVNAEGQKRDIAQARGQMDAYVALQMANAKAAETIAKSQLAVEVQTAETRRKAYQEYVQQASGDLSGEQRIAFLQRAAEQEAGLIRQQTELKVRAIDIERQAAQAELASIDQRIAAADRLNLTEAERINLTGQRRQIEAQIASFDQQTKAVQIAASGELLQAQTDMLDAQQQEYDAIAQAASARDDYLAKLDAQIIALQTGNDALREEADLHKLSAGMAAAEAAAWESAARAKLQQIEALKKAQADQRKEEQAVADQQLRMANYFQAVVTQARNAAQGMAEAFGKTGAAIGQVVVGLAEARQISYQIQTQLARELKNAGGNVAAEQAAYMKATTQELTNQINTFGNLTQAAQSFFDEGTSGYGALQRATQVYRTVELAMALAGYAQMAAASLGFTGSEVVQSQIRGQAAAAEGVANQAKGEPYSAWARMAAMAATMAALGFAVAFSGGSAKQGTIAKYGGETGGTVFGDSSAQSDSISRALDTVAKNSSTDLSYSAAMLRSLQNIESAMAGVTNSLIRNISAVSGIGTARVPGKPAPFDPLMGALGLLTSSRKISDYGIGQLFAQTLNDILAQGFHGQAFTDITTTVKTFGITLSSYTKTYISDLPNEVEREFTRVIASIADSIREAGKAFSLAGEEVIRRIGDVALKFDATSLKGLKGEELQKAIEGQFSKMADQLSAALGIQGLEEFQRVGEGAYATLIRLADGINTASAQLDALGIKAIEYTQIQFKQADVAAEIVRQSIVLFEGISSGIGQFINEAVGSAEDLISTYRDLLAIRDAMQGAGLGWNDITRSMTEAAGGVAALRDAMDSFSTNFLSQGEQYAQSMVTIAREFGKLGFSVPASKEAFRDLVYSIDTSTEAGQELFARLISLSEAFSDAAASAEELDKKYRSYTDPGSEWKDRLQTVIDDFGDIIDGKLGQIDAEFRNRAELAKRDVNAPLQGQVDYLAAYAATRQGEIDRNFQYLNSVTGRIAELQGLISRWSGTKGAAGYIAAWQAELESLNGMADTLRRDIGLKTDELNRINTQIADLQRQIADNAAGIDAEFAKDKLRALTAEKRLLLKQQGDAIVETLREIWTEVANTIRDAQKSLYRQIAELQGGRAPLEFAIDARKFAMQDVRRYTSREGHDPMEAIRRITDAQDAIMTEYNEKLAALQARQQAKIDKAVAQRQRELDAQVQAINDRANRRIDRVNEALDAELEAISEAFNARREAIQEATQAEIDAINEALEAKIEAQRKVDEAALKALQDELSAANELKSAIQQIADYAQKMKLGGLSSLSPEDKVAEAARQYQATLAAAQGGDAKAMGKLSSAADDYLNAARAYYGSGTQYANIFNAMQSALEGVGAMSAPDPDSIQARIDLLREQQAAHIKELQDSVKDQIKAVQDAEKAQLKALASAEKAATKAARDAAQAQIDAIREQAQRQIDRAERIADREIEAIRKGDSNPAIERLKEAAIARLKELAALLDAERKLADEQMRQQIDYAAEQVKLSRRQLNQLRHIAAVLNASLEPPAYAMGGYAQPGIALVGERGPELVRFTAPARVMTASETRSVLSASNDDGKTLAELRAMREQMQAVVTTQSAANPRMVQALENIEARLTALERQVRIAA